jgi:hypothetical protein
MKKALTNKKRLVFVVAAAALVLVVGFKVLTSRGGAGGSAEAAGATGGVEAAGVLDSRPQYLITIARIARACRPTEYDHTDLRDPTVPLVAEPVRRSSGESTAPRETEIVLPPMSFEGIVWDPANPVALIDGNAYRRGDEVHGARIVDVGMESVTLSYRSRQFVLTVK